MIRLFFGWDHRIGRSRFWIGFLVIMTLYPVCDWALAQWLLGIDILEPGLAPEDVAVPAYKWTQAALWIFLLYPLAAVLVKRCRDRNRNVWWPVPWLSEEVVTALLEGAGVAYNSIEMAWWEYAFLAFSVTGLCWIVVDLGLLPGTKGPNRYGPDPREPKTDPGGHADVFD